MTISDMDKAASQIANDATGEFNIAEVLDFDKKAYVLRYFTEFKYGKKPLSDTKYEKLRLLYVLAENGYNFSTSGVWEINSGGPYKVNLLGNVGTEYTIFKLEK